MLRKNLNISEKLNRDTANIIDCHLVLSIDMNFFVCRKESVKTVFQRHF